MLTSKYNETKVKKSVKYLASSLLSIILKETNKVNQKKTVVDNDYQIEQLQLYHICDHRNHGILQVDHQQPELINLLNSHFIIEFYCSKNKTDNLILFNMIIENNQNKHWYSNYNSIDENIIGKLFSQIEEQNPVIIKNQLIVKELYGSKKYLEINNKNLSSLDLLFGDYLFRINAITKGSTFKIEGNTNYLTLNYIKNNFKICNQNESYLFYHHTQPVLSIIKIK